jgi:hypothetical protein
MGRAVPNSIALGAGLQSHSLRLPARRAGNPDTRSGVGVNQDRQ